MREKHSPSDPETRVYQVIDHIFKHSDEDLSRHTLSEVAHYSPEHLPKLFKQIVGQTPKQYSLRLRLEIAFHQLVVNPQRSIQEIALDNGFTGLSVFSRAIKNYFSHSPEQIRRLSHAQQMRLLHTPTPPVAPSRSETLPPPDISVVRQAAVDGCYILTPFNDPGKITRAFQTLYQAEPSSPCFYGILSPHLRNSYRAFMPTASDLPLLTCSIKGGLYARMVVAGDLRATNKAAHYFYRRWLPASGYRIAGIYGFETFTGNPAIIPYHQLQRQIHIPIEPAAVL